MRRSRDYYEAIYENRHSMDKYKCQLKKWYSSRVAVNVQDLHNLPTNIVDELELSDICLIEQYILEKEEMETQEMEEYFVELSDKQEIDKEMVVFPICLKRHLLNKKSV